MRLLAAADVHAALLPAEKARLEAEEAEEKQAKKDASPWYVQILRAGNEAFEVMLKGDDE